MVKLFQIYVTADTQETVMIICDGKEEGKWSQDG